MLTPLGRDAPPARNEVALPRLPRHQARAALRAMGIPERRAGDLADRAHRGLALLRRELGDIAPPRWARPDQARALIPAVLAGRWCDDSPADREVIEQLAGRSYAEVSDALLRWSNEPDPPTRRIGDTWVVTSREDSWSQLARFVIRGDLERLEEAVIRVLGEADPMYDLPEEQRWMAAVYGARRAHSETLRRGLSETLALLGATSELY